MATLSFYSFPTPLPYENYFVFLFVTAPIPVFFHWHLSAVYNDFNLKVEMQCMDWQSPSFPYSKADLA